MSELTIVISGQICRENSANLHSFWRGFINIQNALCDIDKLNIVAHSWNPEFDDLVKKIYSIDILVSGKQPTFVKEFMPRIKPIDKFESGLKRTGSTWKNVNIHNYLGQTRSKAIAISLLKKLDLSGEATILSTRWDQGCSGSNEVNRIIYDISLPKHYFYMAYYNEIDEGYADMWFVAPLDLALHFQYYDKHLLDCLSGENNYFNEFTKSGWPLTKKRNKLRHGYFVYKKIILNKLVLKLNFNRMKSVLFFIKNKIAGIERRLISASREPYISGENSLLITSKSKITFPNYQALNIHAILKYFVISNGFRDKVRFLDVKDFKRNDKGILINPVNFTYVIYSHSSYSDCWSMAIGQALECLPENCTMIYIVSESSIKTEEAFQSYESYPNVSLITYDDDKAYTDRLVSVLSEIAKTSKLVYFVHEDMPLIDKVDQVYLNALLHYMSNSNEYYIKLVDTSYVDTKSDHESFPGLVKNVGGYSFSVQPSLIKPDCLVAFFENFHESIYGLEDTCFRSNNIYSAVKGNRKKGKYVIVNPSFPHIVTAIFKGKWCVNEWKDEIHTMAKKYNLDLNSRGII